LFHIWDIEWNDKRIRPILESVIKHSLGISSKKIYERNCSLEETNSKIANEFFKENHIQGSAKSYKGKYYVLKYNDEIVGAIASTKKQNVVTISRMAFALNTIVVGGQSKLMKAIEKTLQDNEILEYLILNDHFDGNSFKKTGWERISWRETNKISIKETKKSYYASAMYYDKRKPLLESGKALRYYTSGITLYRKVA